MALKTRRPQHARRALQDTSAHRAHLAAPGARVLAPLPRPGKNVFCVGRNYRLHIIEGNLAAKRDPNDFPKAAEFFSKPWTTVIGPGDSIQRHAKHTRILDYEIELGIVIGKGGVDIARESALEHVFGYTIINDVTARDLQKRHGQWFKGKGLDTTCPMGPWVVHRSAVPDAQALHMELDVNGEVRQNASTQDMLFDVPAIIEQLSAGLTLHPGDVIATGTPSGVGFAMTPPRCLEPGDVIRARIDGLGELVNTVVD
ncbi:MAG: fumarylacetoacetate hydrolase family protein [Giesbergeria sp.]|nr:fumarylacetoacetate hydrolase family protein [Burkholderiaceae bacterium]MBP9784347.1 fumarylacetoacetate hydrolase family protein [Giesbergeria sp.]